VDHSGVLVDLDNVGQVGRVTAGEDVHLQTTLAQPPGQLGDIDVQAAGVSHTRRSEWRRMHADHCHSMGIFNVYAHLHLPLRGYRCAGRISAEERGLVTG
jgi:hypothetical protein